MGNDQQETTVVKEEEDDMTTTTTPPPPIVDEQELKDASNSKDDADSTSKQSEEDPEDAVLEDAINDESDDKKEAENQKEKKKETPEEKQKREELKKKYANWPLQNIKEPHDNDVMYGRGGGTNHHVGNKVYRKLVDDRKLDYVNSKRLDKPLVALNIIRTWRTQVPPGRFLKMDEKTGLWNDVGDKKAREKTSQALREKAPLIRKQQEDERKEEGGEEDEPKMEETKTTRFAEGTKEESNKVKKAVLARDHSLGREYLQVGEAVSLEGFSWQDPFKRESSGSASSLPIPPPPAAAAASYPPAGRNSSHGSLGMAPPHHVTSSGGGPPPPPDYYGRVHSDDRQRQFSNGRYESWGTPYAYPPPPPPSAAHGPHHQRSGSWTQTPPSPVPHGAHHNRSGSWNHVPPHRSGSWTGGRDHSLSSYPLVGASISQTGPLSAFDSSRSGSGYWGDPMTTTTSKTLSPPPPPGPYGGPPGPYRSPSNSVTPPPNNTTPSPQNHYHVDPSIANQWSGGEVTRTWSGDQEMRRSYSEDQEMRRSYSREYDDRPVAPYSSASADNSPMRSGADCSNNSNSNDLPRPNMVKRDTSNQNETYETKPSIKRAALNRDNSAATNRLKEQYMPEFYNNGRFDAEREMRTLSDNLELSTLDTPGGITGGLRPRPLTGEQRTSTMDAIAMDLMVKPAPLLDGNRTSTIDALGLVLDDDPIIHPSEMRREESGEEPIASLQRGLPKPNSLTPDNRLTTKDFLDLVTGSDDPVIHPSELRLEESSREEDSAYHHQKRGGLPKPNTLTAENRLTTKDFLDIITEPDDPTINPSELRREESREEDIANHHQRGGLPKPNTLTADNRLTTKDFLDIVNEPDDPIIHPSELRREESREEDIANHHQRGGLPKPNTLTADNRLTTKDFLDIVNEPLAGI